MLENLLCHQCFLIFLILIVFEWVLIYFTSLALQCNIYYIFLMFSDTPNAYCLMGSNAFTDLIVFRSRSLTFVMLIVIWDNVVFTRMFQSNRFSLMVSDSPNTSCFVVSNVLLLC